MIEEHNGMAAESPIKKITNKYIISGRQAFNELMASPNATKISNYIALSDFQTTSIWTERIFAVICNKITQENKIQEKYILSAKDLVPNRPGKSTFDALNKIADEITREKISFDCTVITEDDNEIIAGGGSIAIFDAGFWNDLDKKICVSFNLKLAPFLLNQIKDYTLYDKEEFLELGSLYSQRLYRRLMSVVRFQKSYPTYRITTEDLYFALKPPEGYKQNFARFEDRILKGIVEEINKKTKLKFTYTKRKSGRSIDSILIHFEGNLMIPMNTIDSIEAAEKSEE